MKTKCMNSVCKPGFWKFAHGRRPSCQDIYKRTTRRILQVNIFDRPTRAVPQSFVQRPTQASDESQIVYACQLMSINEPQNDLPKTKRVIIESNAVFRHQARIINQSNEIFQRPTHGVPNNIFLRPTRPIHMTKDIFRRKTRIIDTPQIIFQRPTRPINAAKNIFQRQTRRVEVMNPIFERATRVIHASKNIFERPTRRNANPTDIFHRPTRRIVQNKNDNHNVSQRTVPQLSQAEQKLLDTHHIKPCSVVLDKLSTNPVIDAIFHFNSENSFRSRRASNWKIL